MKSTVPPYILYALLSMVFAGVTSVVAKMGLTQLSGSAGLLIRTAAVFLFVAVITIPSYGEAFDFQKLKLKDVGFLIASGLTTALSWYFYYKAIREGKVSTVAVIDKASLLVTLPLAILVLGEPLTWKLALAALFMLMGLMVLVY